MITALAGGIGGSKLLLGLYRTLPASQLTIIGNTGDDFEIHGLRICPDLDTIIYTLAGIVDGDKGWGRAGDTFECLTELSLLMNRQWFNLGDRDLAVHLVRSDCLRRGVSLTEITEMLSKARGLHCRLLPMADDYRPTHVKTAEGLLHLQEYLVREGTSPRVDGIVFGEGSGSQANEAVLESITAAEVVIVCPSNPFISIGPILAIEDIRKALMECRAPVWAVSPLIGHDSLKGPTAKMMSQLGHEASVVGLARLYAEWIDGLVIDHSDEDARSTIQDLGLQVECRDILMKTIDDKERLAREVLRLSQRKTPS